MNTLGRQVFDLRTQVWQLADNGQLLSPADADRAALVHQIDYHLHAVEGLLRTLGAPVHPAPAPEGAPTGSRGALAAADAPALHPHTPAQPVPDALARKALALAQEVHDRGLSKQSVRVLAQVFEAHSQGLSPNRIAQDVGLPHSTVGRAITAAGKVQTGAQQNEGDQ